VSIKACRAALMGASMLTLGACVSITVTREAAKRSLEKAAAAAAAAGGAAPGAEAATAPARPKEECDAFLTELWAEHKLLGRYAGAALGPASAVIAASETKGGC
jgi:hypothetical protein